MNWLAQLGTPPAEGALSLSALVLNLAVGFLLSLPLRAHYIRFGHALTNRRQFAPNFTHVTLAVVLIITIVRSSLALSLGLVGALSIVRFRTPIKDAEDLSYLFFAIAIGLGLGAGQTLATVVALAFILVVATIRFRGRGAGGDRAGYLELDLPASVEPSRALERMTAILPEAMGEVSLRRLETQEAGVQASFNVQRASAEGLARATEAIRKEWPTARILFVDPDDLPGA